MGKKIIDDITNKPLTRQAKWRLRNQAKGKCSHCSKPAVIGKRCLEHAIYHRELQRGDKDKVRRNTASYRVAG